MNRWSIALALLASVLNAQPPRLKQLKVDAPDLRIEAQTVGIQQRQAVIAVSPNGDILIAPQMGEVVAFDSTGKKLGLKVQTGWSRDLEIRWVSRIGWVNGARWGNNTMWIADPGYRQVVLLDKEGTVTKSLENPSWVRPSWADRRKFPVFSRVDPLALYPDGSWLVIPSNERSLLATPEYDKAFSYFMRIEEGGKMQRTLARVPRDEHVIEVTAGRAVYSFSIPFFARTYWDAAADGMRIALVTPHMRGRDSATFRVTSLDDKGDTVFSRIYPFTPVPIPPATADSARTRTSGRAGSKGPEVAKALADKMPTIYPPVLGIHVGRDRTIWVEVRSASPETRQWMVLDLNGEPIGLATLPTRVTLLESDRSHVWGFERSGQLINAVVRMRVN